MKIAILAGQLGLAATAASTAASTAPQATERPCSSIMPGSTVTLTRSLTLQPPGCALRQVSFEFLAGNLVLDCNQAVLHGLRAADQPNADARPYSAGDAPHRVAFSIVSGEDGPELGNITIRNCNVRNYVDGAEVAIMLKPETVARLRRSDEDEAEAVEERLRHAAPRQVLFERVRIDFPHKSGLYINRYTSRITFRDGAVSNAGNAAIYLESGSHDHSITNSRFTANGFYDYSLTERVRSPKPRPVALREAIAVDSSSHNVIERNIFIGNAAGGVFLYKNCWEHWTDPDQLPRRMHSTDNVIAFNRFENEKVGVWIAARQSRDLKGFDCGDRVVREEKFGPLILARYYRDHAERTAVRLNCFVNVDHGIIVEDESAMLADNVFLGDASRAIVIGYDTGRDGSGRTVTGTAITGNRVSTGSSPSGEAACSVP